MEYCLWLLEGNQRPADRVEIDPIKSLRDYIKILKQSNPS